jgi:hypothetical protein
MEKKNMSGSGRRKGQFFLIGGLLLAVIFFMGLPKPFPLVQQSVVEDLKYVYENLETEFPRALTLGLNNTAAIDMLQNFTRFIDSTLESRYIGFDSLWVVSEGNTSIMTNVSVGNFLAADVNITLNLTDAGGTSTIQYLDVTTDKTGSIEFHSVTSDFNLSLSYNSETETLIWERDKANIYALINLTREDTIKKEEFNY